MPKCTVTVNTEHELVHPDYKSFAEKNNLLVVNPDTHVLVHPADFVSANKLLTEGNLPGIEIESLKLTGTDTDVNNTTQYKVELSVSVTNIDGVPIPQINLRVLDQED